ncbi:hypothetical protein AXF42_Ash010014 [Apostasia shenzhenica]|uniref:Uncharacterized protein n=1 Tax=Apostasia shenzhenica TaxID=1088818 RepID=A0A2I0ACL0_9ASPA|nr:hypothetical protein AXF42_Ash010014 [Apostasia shenzhenica]
MDNSATTLVLPYRPPYLCLDLDTGPHSMSPPLDASYDDYFLKNQHCRPCLAFEGESYSLLDTSMSRIEAKYPSTRKSSLLPLVNFKKPKLADFKSKFDS